MAASGLSRVPVSSVGYGRHSCPTGTVASGGRAICPARTITRSCPGRSSTNRASGKTVPALEFLDGCPGTIDAQFTAVLDAVVAAPPPRFCGGGKWEAMHGSMGGSTSSAATVSRTTRAASRPDGPVPTPRRGAVR